MDWIFYLFPIILAITFVAFILTLFEEEEGI